MSIRARFISVLMIPALLLWAAFSVQARKHDPTTSSANGDPTLDALLSEAATHPAAAPTDTPATAPSVLSNNADDGSRQAMLKLSDGKKISGRFYTTTGQPIRIYDVAKSDFRDIPFKIIKKITAKVLWERQQEEWNFKESGLDQKEFNGKTYPARETQYIVELGNGEQILGGTVAPLYTDTPDGQKTYILHKRDKGEVGQTLKDLVYVQSVEFAE